MASQRRQRVPASSPLLLLEQEGQRRTFQIDCFSSTWAKTVTLNVAQQRNELSCEVVNSPSLQVPSNCLVGTFLTDILEDSPQRGQNTGWIMGPSAMG